MVKHADAKQLATVFETPSQDAIFLTGSRIAARMVVGQDNGARVHKQKRLEDFAGMDDAHGDRSDADGVDADNRMFRVETDDQEMLTIESIEERYKGAGILSGNR